MTLRRLVSLFLLVGAMSLIVSAVPASAASRAHAKPKTHAKKHKKTPLMIKAQKASLELEASKAVMAAGWTVATGRYENLLSNLEVVSKGVNAAEAVQAAAAMSQDIRWFNSNKRLLYISYLLNQPINSSPSVAGNIEAAVCNHVSGTEASTCFGDIGLQGQTLQDFEQETGISQGQIARWSVSDPDISGQILVSSKAGDNAFTQELNHVYTVIDDAQSIVSSLN